MSMIQNLGSFSLASHPWHGHGVEISGLDRINLAAWKTYQAADETIFPRKGLVVQPKH